MASKPTSNYEWATDAAYDSDAAPNKIEPPSVLRENGWERGEEPGAQHVNEVLNAHGEWHGWAEASIDDLGVATDALETFTGIDETNRQIRVGAHRARVERGTWIPGLIESGLSCTDDTGSSGRSILRFDVSAGVELPWKGTVTGVQVQVRPGGARASGSKQLRAILQRVEANPETMAAVETTLGGTGFVEAENNGKLQLIFLTPTSPVSINGEATSGNNHRLMVLIETGVSDSAAVDDTVYDVRFTCTTEVR